MNKKMEIIYGMRTVIEALKSGQPLERLFIQKNLKSQSYKELMECVQASSTPVSKVPIERIHRYTRKKHQGVVALVSPIHYHSVAHLIPRLFEEGKNPLLLILDEVTDVRNFGAIARTAECMGVHGIVIPVQGGAQVNEDSLKASSGAFNYLPVCRENNLIQVTDFLKNSGLHIVACTEKATMYLDEVDLSLPVALIMGSEQSGISPALSKRANASAKIKMQGNIEALNVSVATGMALYEVQRQRIHV